MPPERKKGDPYSSKNRRCSFLMKNIKRSSKDNFKAWCSARGYTMTEVLERFMIAVCDTEEDTTDIQRAVKQVDRSLT